MAGEWNVSGYGDLEAGAAGWTDVENGGTPVDFDADPENYGSMTIHHHDTDTGEDVYFTIHPPYDDWDDIEDLIDYYLTGYGVTE